MKSEKELRAKAKINHEILLKAFDEGLEYYRGTGKWPDNEGSELDAFNEASLKDQANWMEIRIKND